MKIIGFLLAIHLTSTTQYSPSVKMVKEGEETVIDCSLTAREGVYWFFQPENSKLEFLLYFSAVDKIHPRTDPRYDCRRSFSKVSLIVKNFTKKDCGKYYCVTLKNLAMEFGNMVARCLEEVKTTPKATTALTTSSKATTAAPTSEEKPPCTPTKSAMNEDKISCHLFVWAPLTGAASLLFLALIFVSVLYCKRPRRRRCQHQFRKRPIPEDVRRPLNNYH
ncbi:T-cell surface glycoprotein CD8 alpha chain [Pristis pectinata]|uniref:T-cell surface glycoprotein CD8 alpha chain n=1 Tax=Pristis pectinata TaxID=685728 RepID=UPI00223D2745|nr:T-cell surface glycoprotein CD8 alpha chain [Pristis pectinata]